MRWAGASARAVQRIGPPTAFRLGVRSRQTVPPPLSRMRTAVSMFSQVVVEYAREDPDPRPPAPVRPPSHLVASHRLRALSEPLPLCTPLAPRPIAARSKDDAPAPARALVLIALPAFPLVCRSRPSASLCRAADEHGRARGGLKDLVDALVQERAALLVAPRADRLCDVLALPIAMRCWSARRQWWSRGKLSSRWGPPQERRPSRWPFAKSYR